MRIISAFFIMLFIAFSSYKNNYSVRTDNIKQGEKAFKKSCSPCHDIHIKMFGPPLIHISSSYLRFIKKYKQTTACQNDSVNDTQLKYIVDYVRKNKNHVEY